MTKPRDTFPAVLVRCSLCTDTAYTILQEVAYRPGKRTLLTVALCREHMDMLETVQLSTAELGRVNRALNALPPANERKP